MSNFNTRLALALFTLILFITYGTILLPLEHNQEQLKKIQLQVERLNAKELSLAANFAYWSYVLSNYDAQARLDLQHLSLLMVTLRKQIRDYNKLYKEPVSDKEHSVKSFLNATLERNNAYKAWQAVLTMCEQSDSVSLKQLLEELQQLGQEITKNYLNQEQTAIFSQLKEQSTQLHTSGKEINLIGNSLNDTIKQQSALGNNQLEEALLKFNAACSFTPLLMKQTDKIVTTVNFLEQHKQRLLETTSYWFFSLYEIIYTTLIKVTTDLSFYTLIAPENTNKATAYS